MAASHSQQELLTKGNTVRAQQAWLLARVTGHPARKPCCQNLQDREWSDTSDSNLEASPCCTTATETLSGAGTAREHAF